MISSWTARNCGPGRGRWQRKLEAKDIDGNPVTFKVPAGSSSGAEVKLAGLGVQRSNQPGDLIGRVQIMVPAKPGLAVKHAAKEFDEKAGDYLSL